MDILWKYFGIISFKRLNLGNSMEVYYIIELLSVILQNCCGNVIIFRNIPEISETLQKFYRKLHNYFRNIPENTWGRNILKITNVFPKQIGNIVEIQWKYFRNVPEITSSILEIYRK